MADTRDESASPYRFEQIQKQMFEQRQSEFAHLPRTTEELVETLGLYQSLLAIALIESGHLHPQLDVLGLIRVRLDKLRPQIHSRVAAGLDGMFEELSNVVNRYS